MKAQKQLHSFTLLAANWICIVGLIDVLPAWLTIAAGIYCFLDYLAALAMQLPKSEIQ